MLDTFYESEVGMPTRLTGIIMAIIAISLATAIAVSTQGERPTHAVDFVSPPPGATRDDSRVPPSRQLRVPFGRRGRSTNEKELPKPLAVRLISIDRTAYSVGDAFVYELLVSNRGSEPFAFPVSRDGDRFSDRMGDPVVAHIGLTFEDAALGRQFVGVLALYGAQDVPGSVIVIRPSETLELRAPGQWFLQSGFPTPLARDWARELQVKGSVQIHSTKQALDPIQSENALTIHLKER